MGLGDILSNIKATRDKNTAINTLKYRLLQRLTMKQLQELYTKYCYVEATPIKLGDNPTAMDLLKLASQPGGAPNSRQKLIDKIGEAMTWDSLKMWAKDNKVKYEDLGG